MIERLADVPAGIFGVRAVGTLTAEDYESMIAAVVDDVTRKRLRCLVEVGPEFTGVTPAAAWEDLRLGLRAMRAPANLDDPLDHHIRQVRQQNPNATLITTPSEMINLP